MYANDYMNFREMELAISCGLCMVVDHVDNEISSFYDPFLIAEQGVMYLSGRTLDISHIPQKLCHMLPSEINEMVEEQQPKNNTLNRGQSTLSNRGQSTLSNRKTLKSKKSMAFGGDGGKKSVFAAKKSVFGGDRKDSVKSRGSDTSGASVFSKRSFVASDQHGMMRQSLKARGSDAHRSSAFGKGSLVMDGAALQDKFREGVKKVAMVTSAFSRRTKRASEIQAELLMKTTFMIVFRTVHHYPRVPIHDLLRLRVIPFTITKERLHQRLLTIVFERCAPKTAGRIADVYEDHACTSEAMHEEIENALLGLADISGMDDEDHLRSLIDVGKAVPGQQEILEDHKSIIETVPEAKSTSVPLTEAAVKMFWCLEKFMHLHPFYQFSLSWFEEILISVLEQQAIDFLCDEERDEPNTPGGHDPFRMDVIASWNLANRDSQASMSSKRFTSQSTKESLFDERVRELRQSGHLRDSRGIMRDSQAESSVHSLHDFSGSRSSRSSMKIGLKRCATAGAALTEPEDDGGGKERKQTRKQSFITIDDEADIKMIEAVGRGPKAPIRRVRTGSILSSARPSGSFQRSMSMGRALSRMGSRTFSRAGSLAATSRAGTSFAVSDADTEFCFKAPEIPEDLGQILFMKLHEEASLGFFAHHVLSFSFWFTLKAFVNSDLSFDPPEEGFGCLSDEEVNYIFSSGDGIFKTSNNSDEEPTTPASPSERQKRCPVKWMQVDCWERVESIGKLSIFKGLLESLQEGRTQKYWKQIYESTKPQTENIPVPFNLLPIPYRFMLLKALRPDCIQDCVREYVAAKLGDDAIKEREFEIDDIWQVGRPTRPIFIMGDANDHQEELSRDLKKIADTKSIYFNSIAVERDIEQILEHSLIDAQHDDGWLLIRNFDRADHHVYDLVLRALSFAVDNDDFQIFLMASIPAGAHKSISRALPVSLLHVCVKRVKDAPRGIKQSMQDCLDTYRKKFTDLDTDGRRLFLSLALLHSLLVVRTQSVILGGTPVYSFSTNDFNIAQSHILDDTVVNNRAWRQSMVELIGGFIYGEHVLDSQDQALLDAVVFRVLVADLDEALEEVLHAKFYTDDLDLSQAYGIIDRIPSYGEFGLAASGLEAASILSLKQASSSALLADLGELHALTYSGIDVGGDDLDALVQQKYSKAAEVAEAILSELPNRPFGMMLRRESDLWDESGGEASVYSAFVYQEKQLYADLLSTIRGQLNDFCNGISGEKPFLFKPSELIDALNNNKLPKSWRAASYPTLKPLGSWVTDLAKRLKYLKKFFGTSLQKQAVVWVPAFFRAKAFLDIVRILEAIQDKKTVGEI